MNNFIVLTDSTADIEKKFRKEVGLDYLMNTFTLDGKEFKADLDWPQISPNNFYKKMMFGSRAITGTVTKEEVTKKVGKAFKDGLDVLYIACSSKLSESVNVAKEYAHELLRKYPDRRFECYDSLRSNYALGLMAYHCQEMANNGKTLDEVIEYLNLNRLKYQSWATTETLSYLAKSGRIRARKAFFGNLFGVKPLIVSDVNGNNYAYNKVKGRKTSLDELVDEVVNRLEEPSKSIIFIAHADTVKDAEYIKNEIEKKIQVKEIHISELGPIVGASIGPGSIVISFFGHEVTIKDHKEK